MPDTTIINPLPSKSSAHDDADAILAALGKRLSNPSGAHPANMSDADRTEYLAMLRGEYPTEALPDEQAHGLLDALWSIMVAFVDLGFPPAPLPYRANNASGVAAPCGQITKNLRRKCDTRSGDALNSSHQSDMQNDKAAPMNAADGRES